MKRFAWVVATVLGLALAVPVTPAMAEDLDQGISDQLEEAQVINEQDSAETIVVLDDGNKALNGIEESDVDAQDDVDDVIDKGEAVASDAPTCDDGIVTEGSTNETAVDPQPEGDQFAELMGVSGSDSDPVSEETVYSIAPSASTSVVVGVANNSASSGANVVLSGSGGGLGNYWRVVSRNDGTWSIINMLANMALTVNGTPASGANVKVASGNGTAWTVLRNEDGTISFIPLGHDSLRLDISGGSTTAGANVQLYECNGTPAQRFALSVANALTDALINGGELDEGVVTIGSGLSGNGVIDIQGASKSNGGNAQRYSYNNSLAQKFFIADAGNGLYTLKCAVSGKYLDAYGGGVTSGTNVQQYTGNGSLAQLWYFIETADGLWSLRNAKSGLALSVAGGSTSNGANIELEEALDVTRQRFTVKPVNLFEKNQVLRLTPIANSSLNVSTSSSTAALSQCGTTADGWWRVDTTSGDSFTLASLFGAKKLTVSGSVASGASVMLASGAGTTWSIRVNDGGSLTISPKGYPGLVLDVKNGKVGNGANLQVYKSNGTNAQRFVATSSANLTKAASSAKVMSACVYTVKSSLGSNLVLDVKGGSQSTGANVQIYGSNSSNAQKWELQYADSRLYRIRSINSLFYLGVAGSTNGSNVAQYKSDDGLSQYWYFMANGDGYTICNAANGLVLDVQNGKAANGSNVQLYTSNGTTAQKWVMADTPLIKNGTYVFSSDLTVYGMLVLDVQGGSKASGANVQAYQSNGTDAQKWMVTYKGTGAYTLASKNSGLLLTVADSSLANGGNVVQKTNENSNFQLWTISLVGSNSYVFKNVGSGKVLDIKNGKSDNGVNVQQYSANGSKAQTWHIKTNHNPLPSNAKLAKFVSRMIYYTDIVNVGYDMGNRWDIRDGGETDCSALVIRCLQEAGFNAESKGATYTGNMRSVLKSLGWSVLPWNINNVKAGDILLNDQYHTCAVISGSGKTALVAQASIDENYYGWGGKAGDQTGYETNIKTVYTYSYGWNCILRYTGK